MQLVNWLNAQAKHESDIALGQMRRDRLLAYKIVASFAGEDMPGIGQWWPLPGDEVIIKEEKPVQVSAKTFVSAFGAAFRSQ